jgi:hypothetical protein
MKLTIDLSGSGLADDVLYIRDAYDSLTLLAAEAANNTSYAASPNDVANVMMVLDRVQEAAFKHMLDTGLLSVSS